MRIPANWTFRTPDTGLAVVAVWRADTYDLDPEKFERALVAPANDGSFELFPLDEPVGATPPPESELRRRPTRTYRDSIGLADDGWMLD